ncbi:MAG: hypothetical protein AABZ63_00565 [Actinomycetota bacterium]
MKEEIRVLGEDYFVNLYKADYEVLLASGYSEAMDQQAISDRGYRLMRKPYSLSEVLMVIHGMVSK